MFTWASPCSGGCSEACPKCGWGYCSDAQWAHLPESQMRNEKPCSAHIFDPMHNHCDSGGVFRQHSNDGHSNGGYDEQVFCFIGGAGSQPPCGATESPTESPHPPTTYPSMAPATPATVASIDVPEGWKAAPRYLTADESEIRPGSYFLALEQFTTTDPVSSRTGPGLADFWWVNRSMRGATVFDITPTDRDVPITPSVFPVNSSFTVHCSVPVGQTCDVFAFIYHDPPISSTTNGGLITLVDDGWEASSCAPAFRLFSNGGPEFNPAERASGGAYEGCVYHMVAMRNSIGKGESVTIKLEERRGAFILFAVVPKVVCGNTMTEAECEATHTDNGPLSTCAYVDNACIDNWCARRHTTRPPAFTRPPTMNCPAANAGL